MRLDTQRSDWSRRRRRVRQTRVRDARTAFEQNGIGWTMWDYRGGFGVVTKSDGNTVPDPLIVEALGLKAP